MKDKMLFTSSFAPMLASFIEEKYSLGYKYESECARLKHFDRYCTGNGIPAVLNRELIMDYIKPDPNRSTKTTLNLIGILRQFAFYLQRNGYDAYVFPEELFPKREETFHPYIFTRDDICQFLDVAEHIPYNKQFPIRHLVLPLLFRTLYCCGLRISEALNLKVKDVDLENGILTLHNTKDYRDRLIPLSSDLHERYLDYYEQVPCTGNAESIFFPSLNGKSYSGYAVARNYREFLWKCGISYGGRKKGPHLHSLRHTFSVHCLQSCMSRGKELQEFLPILSAYLGHKTFQGTQKYLHLTAELYPDILTKVEEACANLIPKAGAADE